MDLGQFRSYISNSVPILAASATLLPSILKQVQACLLISKNDSFLVNLGNDRLNIMSILCHMCGAASDLAALDFTLDEGLSGNALKRTIIFFNTRELTQLGYRHLKRQLPQNMHDQIGFLHACRTTDAKNETMESFQEGKIKILCATEAAGMVRLVFSFIDVFHSQFIYKGLDIPDIEQVIQYMVPSSLSICVQHFGRAGRNGQPAIAILLAEPSAFQTKKKNKTKVEANKDDVLVKSEPIDDTFLDSEDEGDRDGELGMGMEYRKKLEEGMRQWAEALTCRREVANGYFNNPPPHIWRVFFCTF